MTLAEDGTHQVLFSSRLDFVDHDMGLNHPPSMARFVALQWRDPVPLLRWVVGAYWVKRAPRMVQWAGAGE